jgi:hypothetical protein
MVVADNDGDKGGELICHKGDASAQEFMRRRWLDEQICTERALESFWIDGVVRDDRRDEPQNANLGTFLIERFGNDGTMLLLLVVVLVDDGSALRCVGGEWWRSDKNDAAVPLFAAACVSFVLVRVECKIKLASIAFRSLSCILNCRTEEDGWNMSIYIQNWSTYIQYGWLTKNDAAFAAACVWRLDVTLWFIFLLFYR